ncbi:hypothetical protein BGZ46_010418 [Entomortierella lignicola]|nr:hypothetical protein BGZ46_010418 [Entomortierella lignicola]
MTSSSLLGQQQGALESTAASSSTSAITTSTAVTNTATTTAKSSISTPAAINSSFNASTISNPSTATVVTIDGYKVHPSALTASTLSPAPAGNMTAVAAAQRAAALASSDSILIGNASRAVDNSSSSEGSSGIVQEVVKGLMPLGLALVMGYIFYVYTFHVCIDHILNVEHRPIQAGMSNCLGPGSPLKPPQKNPPPPIPSTTTKYQPTNVKKSVSQQSHLNIRNDNTPTDTTPLLRPSSGPSNLHYHTDSQRDYTSNMKSKNLADQNEGSVPGSFKTGSHTPTIDGDGAFSINIESDTHHQGYTNNPIATLSIAKRDGRHLMTIWVVVTMIPLLITAIRKCDLDIILFETEILNSQQPQCKINGQWAILTTVSLILSLFIVPFTALHTVHILKNRTTIESLQDMRATFIKLQYTRTDLPPYWPSSGFSVIKVDVGENIWDRGTKLANWKSIMGPTWWLWFLPYANSQGDGIHDVYSEKVYKRLLEQAMGQISLQKSNYEARIQKTTTKSSTEALAGQESGVTIDGAGSSNSILNPWPMRNGKLGSSQSQGVVQSGKVMTESEERKLMEANSDLAPQESTIHRRSESEDSVDSLGRSLPTPRSSPRLEPTE